jgi:hypothetical protein
LDRRQHLPARRATAVEWRRRDAVDAKNAHHFLDDIGLAVHVGPPCRHRDFQPFAVAGGEKAEAFEDPAHFRQRYG